MERGLCVCRRVGTCPSKQSVHDQAVAVARYKQAFRALEQASRHMHTKWKVWANYVTVAAQVNNYSKAIYGMGLLLELWYVLWS